MVKIKNTRPRDTWANRIRKDKTKSMQRFEEQNGAWKGGISPHYYRRIANAKPGEIVIHKNLDSTDNRKKNLVKVKSMSAFNKKRAEFEKKLKAKKA